MLSKILVTLLAASSAIVSVSADPKFYGRDSYYKDDYYRDDGYKGGHHRSPKVVEKEDIKFYGHDDYYKDDYYKEDYYRDDRYYKDDYYEEDYYRDDSYYKEDYYRDDGYYKDDYYSVEREEILEEFLPKERVERYGPHVDVLEKEAAFKSMKYPEVVYPKVAQKEEFSEGHLDVKYYKKYPPKPQGAIIFPSEYAKYETHSEGPHVPHFKPRKIYADVFEKQFVCPKFEKIVYVTIPGKCTCEPINVHPKIIKAPKIREDKFFDGHEDYHGRDEEIDIKEFKEVKITEEDGKRGGKKW